MYVITCHINEYMSVITDHIRIGMSKPIMTLENVGNLSYISKYLRYVIHYVYDDKTYVSES